jgi:hypothetical protein
MAADASIRRNEPRTQAAESVFASEVGSASFSDLVLADYWRESRRARQLQKAHEKGATQ